jgi:hypothetical protein
MDSWQAGAAAIDITGPVGAMLGGYGGRTHGAGYEVGCALSEPECAEMIIDAAVALVRSLYDEEES